MKHKIIYRITALVLMVFCGIAVSALSLDVGGTGTGIVLSGVMENLDKDIVLLEENEELTVGHFPTGGFGAYLDSEGRGQLVPVVWHLDADELTEPGLHEVTCTPVLSETVMLADGYDGVTTWPVFRKGEGTILNVESVRKPENNIINAVIPANSDCDEELSLSESVSSLLIGTYWWLDVRNDPEFFWKWDLSAVDTSVPGRYSVTAELHYPDWVYISEEYRTHEYIVYVLPEDRIEIYAGIHLADDGELTIHWLYDSVNVAETILETETADGVWEACPTEWYTYYPWNSRREAYLVLELSTLPKETPLTLRLRYTDVIDGKTVERTTSPILLQVPENWKDLTQNFDRTSLIAIFDGDRDGGDNGGAVLPDMEQPAPVPDNTLSKIQEDIAQYLRLMKEVVTKTSTTISGLRVNLQASREKTLLFEKQGVAVEIPSERLLALSLKMNDSLKVTILRPETDTVQLSVTVNNKLADNLTGTVIRMPWKEAPVGQLVCQDADEKEISEAIYDPTVGTVQFSVNAPGVYRLKEVETILSENGSAV